MICVLLWWRIYVMLVFHLRAILVGYRIFMTLFLWTLPILMHWHLGLNVIGLYLKLDWFFPYLLVSCFLSPPLRTCGLLPLPLEFKSHSSAIAYFSPLNYSILFQSSHKIFSISKKFPWVLSLGIFFVLFVGFSTSGTLFCVYNPTFNNVLKKITVISNCFSNVEIKI